MSDKAVLFGDLCFISLADCFQILGGNNSTGTLQISSPYVSSSGNIHFIDGNPVNAKSQSLQGLEAIYSLFGWTEGTFAFHEEPVDAERVINSGRMEIVLDALRMLDDGLIKEVGRSSINHVSDVNDYGPGKGKGEFMPVVRGPLADYMYVIDEEGFRDGMKIVREGGHGTWIWVILEGVVRITRQTSAGTMDIARFGEGCFIGTLTSFLQRDYVRSATVSAEGDIQLGVLDTQRLYKEYAGLTSDFRTLIFSLDGRLKKITDRAVELHEKGHGDEVLTSKEPPALSEGTGQGEVFSIMEGQAQLVRETPKGYLPLLTLEGGDVFGNVPFLDMGHEPRRASVIGSEDLKLNRLDAAKMAKEYARLSPTFRNLLDNTCTCVALTTRVASYLQEAT